MKIENVKGKAITAGVTATPLGLLAVDMVMRWQEATQTAVDAKELAAIAREAALDKASQCETLQQSFETLMEVVKICAQQ